MSETEEQKLIKFLEFMVYHLTDACGPAGDDVYEMILNSYTEEVPKEYRQER